MNQPLPGSDITVERRRDASGLLVVAFVQSKRQQGLLRGGVQWTYAPPACTISTTAK